MDRLMRGLEFTLALAFCFTVLLNFANVIGRYRFNYSIHGADELQVQVMIAMAFLGAAIVSWRGEHLRMDVLVQRLPHGLQRSVRVFEAIVMVVLAGFVLVQSSRYTYQMFHIGRASDALGIPVWMVHSLVVIGFTLIVMVALRKAYVMLAARGAP
jgi:TRAP-type transport system small permease protein